MMFSESALNARTFCYYINLRRNILYTFGVHRFQATKWKFGIVLSFQNMTNTNYTHARSPQQLSFSMHWANDVCRLGSFRFLFKSHLDIIIKLAIYSGKLNRKRKNSFSWIAVFYLSRILHSYRLTMYEKIYLRVNW